MAHSSILKAGLGFRGLCPVHRGLIAMSGSSNKAAVRLQYDHAIRPEAVPESGGSSLHYVQLAGGPFIYSESGARLSGLCPVHRGLIAMSGSSNKAAVRFQ